MSTGQISKQELAVKIAQNEGLSGASLKSRIEELQKLTQKELEEKLQTLLNSNAAYISTGSDDDWKHMGVMISGTTKTQSANKTNSAAQTQPQNTCVSEASANVTAEYLSSPIEYKESQYNAIQEIQTSLDNALLALESQNDGGIGKIYNKLKEKFNAQLARTNVERVIYSQLRGADYMELAANNQLTYNEYYNAIKERLFKTFPGIDKMTDEQKERLKQSIGTLSPEQILRHQKAVLNLPEEDSPEYADALADYAQNFQQETTTKVTTNISTRDGLNATRTEIKVNEPYNIENGERLVTFEEVYKNETGIEFNAQKIQEYSQNSIEFALMSNAETKVAKIHEILDDATTLVDGNNKNGITPEIAQASTDRLQNALSAALKELYGENEEVINLKLANLLNRNDLEYKDGKIQYKQPADSQFAMNMDSYTLVDISKSITTNLEKNKTKLLKGKPLQYYAEKMADSYKQAYGENNASQLAKAYVQDQQDIVKNVRAGVEYIGTGVMVAGMFIAPPLAIAGGAVASIGGVYVETMDELSKKGYDSQKMNELLKELVQNSALMAAGFGAGKIGSAAKAALLAKNSPKLVATVADVGTDATLSLLSDLAITGQINLEGEGISQMISLVAGHSKKLTTAVKNAMHNQQVKHQENLSLNKYSMTGAKNASAAAPEQTLTNAGIFDKEDIEVFLKNNPDITPQMAQDITDYCAKTGMYDLNRMSYIFAKAGARGVPKETLYTLINLKNAQGQPILDSISLLDIAESISPNLDAKKAQDIITTLLKQDYIINAKPNHNQSSYSRMGDLVSGVLQYCDNDNAITALKIICDPKNNSLLKDRGFYQLQSILKNIKTPQDVKNLETILKTNPKQDDLFDLYNYSNMDNQGVRENFTLLCNAKDENGKLLYTTAEIGDILSTVTAYPENINLLEPMIKNKVSGDDIYEVLNTPVENLQAYGIYKRITQGNVPKNFKVYTEINPQTDLQKKAYDILNPAGENTPRVESLAQKQIINAIKDEADLQKLEQLLQNKNLNAQQITEAFTTGKMPDIAPQSSFSDIKTTFKQFKSVPEIAKQLCSFSNGLSNTKALFYANNLAKLKAQSPQRYQKMVDSGLFELIKSGKVKVDILEKIDGNKFLSNRALEDIRKIYNDESPVIEIEGKASVKNFLQQVPDGEVGEVNGQLYLNDNGKPVKINMDKQTFEKLFPAGSSFAQQGNLGDCWLISTLENLMDKPAGRKLLYSMIRQDGDDIYVKLPNSTKEVKFTNGEVVKSKYQMAGAPGLKMIEQAYAIHKCSKISENSTIDAAKLTDIDNIMNKLDGGWQQDAIMDLTKINAQNSLGSDLTTKKDMYEAIVNYANNKDVFVSFGTITKNTFGREKLMGSDYDLYTSHAYSIKGYNPDTGMVYISNPHKADIITEIPIYELMRYIRHVTVAKLR